MSKTTYPYTCKNSSVARMVVTNNKRSCDFLCRNPGLNRGPLDLQSNALPTELFRQVVGGASMELMVGEMKYKRTHCARSLKRRGHCHRKHRVIVPSHTKTHTPP